MGLFAGGKSLFLLPVTPSTQNTPANTKCGTGLCLHFTSVITVWNFSLPSGFILSNVQLLEPHLFLPVTFPSISEMLKPFENHHKTLDHRHQHRSRARAGPSQAPSTECMLAFCFPLGGGQTIPDPAQSSTGRGREPGCIKRFGHI